MEPPERIEYKHMLDSVTAQQLNFQGVPVTEPLTNTWQVHEALTNMSIAYPGEMFTIESPMGNDDRTMVVTWIPKFYMDQFLSQIIASRVRAPTYWNW